MVDVLVAGGRGIGAQRRLVAGNGGRHAQARVGIDVVGADQALGQLVEDVVILRQQLAGDIEGDRIRAVFADDLGKAVGDIIQRFIPADCLPGQIAVTAQFRLQGATFRLGAQVQGRPLGAQPPEIRRMLRVAAHTGDTAAFALDDDATADAAIATCGSGFLHIGLLHIAISH